MTEKTKDIVSNQSGNEFGCIVEWRFKTEVKLVGVLDDFPHRSIPFSKKWGQAPYDIRKMCLLGLKSDLIRPIIGGYRGAQLADYDLVEEDVAEAIIACLKTSIRADKRLWNVGDNIEFRIRHCEVKYSWEVTRLPIEETE